VGDAQQIATDHSPFAILDNFGALATEICTFLISASNKFTCDIIFLIN